MSDKPNYGAWITRRCQDAVERAEKRKKYRKDSAIVAHRINGKTVFLNRKTKQVIAK